VIDSNGRETEADHQLVKSMIHSYQAKEETINGNQRDQQKRKRVGAR